MLQKSKLWVGLCAWFIDSLVHDLCISVKGWFCQDRPPEFNLINAVCMMVCSLWTDTFTLFMGGLKPIHSQLYSKIKIYI